MLTELFLRIAFIGAEWVLWLLLLLSFISVGIIVDRLLFFRSNLEEDEQLNNQLPEFLRAGDIKGAWELASASDSVAGKVLTAGLQTMRRGSDACSEAMQSAKARFKGLLDARLSVLGTIGANAPFIGLMGTVLGVIKASNDLSAKDPDKIMFGVFQALIATAVGLFVAIPAVVAYNFFQRKVRTAMAQIDSLAHLVLANVHAAEHRGTANQVPQSAKAI
ncbi:MAG TPA: MotA/TolQ/ExbB proton channel family protein [Pirellulales bacterium]|nr:MotA/TolQ/ExbB proton channel family protein [Pirellulales bacterium]